MNMPSLTRSVPDHIVERLEELLGSAGDRSVSFVETAAEFIRQADADTTGRLRLCESAAYALRQALDAITGDDDPAAGGLGEILEAWGRYTRERDQPETNTQVAREEFEAVMARAYESRDRNSDRARRLIMFLQRRTGLRPATWGADAVAEYETVRSAAAWNLHKGAALAEVVELYEEVVGLLERLFTPPEARHDALLELARQDEVGPPDIARLQSLALNAHHLRLFLADVERPNWIGPLLGANLVTLPDPDEPWPVLSLVGGLGRHEPRVVADLLQGLFDRAQRTQDANLRLFQVRTIATAAHQLGLEGKELAAAALRLWPDDQVLQFVAIQAALGADPSDPVVAEIVDLTLVEKRGSTRRYQTPELLARLADGLTAENASERVKTVAAKVRRLAKQPSYGLFGLDISALTTDLSGREDPIVMLAHGLVILVQRAQSLGVSSRELLTCVDGIAGFLGARVTSQILATATDIGLDEKIRHVTTRLQSAADATGDDLALVESILEADPTGEALSPWVDILGEPSATPTDPLDLRNVPDDWVMAWRWSPILPEAVLERWRGAIAAVQATAGTADGAALVTRVDPYSGWATGQSPYTVDELSRREPLDAAALVAQWRREPTTSALVGARELGRTLEEVVKAAPEGWTTDPIKVISALREPTYIDHYFRAVREVADQLAKAAPDLLAAAEFVRTHPWDPTVLGSDHFEYDPDWTLADTEAIDMVGALANNEAEFGDTLDVAWTMALAAARDRPDTAEPAPESLSSNDDEADPFTSAINRRYTKAFETALALAGWEFRNLGQVRDQFTDLLGEVIEIPGWIGLEYRAILASRRPFLETVVTTWLDERADALFGSQAPDNLGRVTLDLTITWSRQTPWFHQRLRTDLISACRRGTKNAVSYVLIGTLAEVPGYEVDTVIRDLSAGGTAPVTAAAQEMAFQVQNTETAPRHLAIAIDFWRSLLSWCDQRRNTPANQAVIAGLGRWAFVRSVDHTTWDDLMLATVERCHGAVDLATEVADRAATDPPTAKALRILEILAGSGNGDPWERDHIQSTALRAARTGATDPDLANEVRQLRNRLLELGRHEARDIQPPT
jgi:hypothetical protein